MQKTRLSLPEIKLVGLPIQTSYKIESPLSSKIGPCVQKYFEEKFPNKIPHRKNKGRTICAYSNYESDYTGEYTFYIGEEVESFGELPEELVSHSIPPQSYIKFTTPPGVMPDVVIKAWQEIWEMSPHELGGVRRYATDFQIHDERAMDPLHTIVDIYIGVQN